MTPRIRVAVLAGGRSSEHEISLASARSVVDALDPDRYETRTIEIGRDGAWALPPGPGAPALDEAHASLPIPTTAAPQALGAIDVVLPILHGPFGEDGTVQGLLELADIPYIGAGVTASALCMDKDLFKAVLRDRGIPVASSVTLRTGDAVENPFGYPVFVKPARLGSSVGISKATTPEELEVAVALARQHDDKVLVEEFQPGVEVEVGVLGNREPVASVVGEIVAHADWYDFDAKYAAGGMDLIVPARLPDETTDEVRRLAIEAFVATDCEGMARVDFFVRPDGQVVVNELNTIPGFTATSVYAKLFAESGIPYADLLDRLSSSRSIATRSGGRSSTSRLAEDALERVFPDAESLFQNAVLDRQRGEDADAVPGDPGLEEDQPALESSIDHGRGELGCRLAGCGIDDQLDREHCSEPTHVADPWPARLPGQHPLTDACADHVGAADEILVLEDVDDGQRGRERDGVADVRSADRPGVRRVHDCGLADHARERESGSDRLGDDTSGLPRPRSAPSRTSSRCARSRSAPRPRRG